MTPPRLEPSFIDGFDGGRRLALWVLPPHGVRTRGSILAVQPFGDEANLSRRVLLAQSMRLGGRGWATLMLDIFGTGDSEGRPDEATLAIWRADLLRGARLARERTPGAFVLWGTRFGSLLVSDIAEALDQLVSAFVFWQPAATGSLALDPLLRLDKAGALARVGVAGRDDPGAPESEDRDAPAGDDAVFSSLGGYRLRRRFLADLAQLTLHPPPLGRGAMPRPALFVGIQRAAGSGAPAPKALSDLVAQWLSAGHLAGLRMVRGEPFWSSMEPSSQGALFDATETFLESVHAPQ